MTKQIILLTLTLVVIGCLNKNSENNQKEMGFFNRKSKPTINSVKFDTFGWNLAQDTKQNKVWVNETQTALVSINFFDGPSPDVPGALEEVDKIRNHHRDMIVREANGGLIKCEVISLKGYDFVEIIVKRPNKPTGMTYTGFLIMPFKNYNFMIMTQAVEAGMTGTREAVVADKWMKENGVPEIDDDGNIKGWAKDPYDEKFSKGNMMNYAENEEFDKDFPDHPLTVVRKKMKEIKESISFDDDLSKLEKI